jgi:hypothetical protein
MITPQYTITVSDINFRASFDKLTPALRRELRPVITKFTHTLLAQVKAREPVRTGYLRSRTHAFVDERPTLIRGRVRIIPTGRAQRTAAAFGALEYGAHKRFIVAAHERSGAHVRAYLRRVNLAPRRFLRGPAATMRPRIMAELQAAIARAIK